ncbi:MAG: hypothetical protein ACXWRE_07585 [Pseudobdellovibrionaceae bacterium]
MDFYNLQESDHRLIEQTLFSLPESQQYKNQLFRHFLNVEKLLNKKNILLLEEDPRIQGVIKNLILEANSEAVCWTVDAIEDIANFLEKTPCDLLIANYYLSEDEIDYEYWEGIRAGYPETEVIIFSHINDREYYNILKKMTNLDTEALPLSWTSRLRHFLRNKFGG